MQKFCSFEFTKAVEKTCGMSDLMPDVGLHGAGLFLQKNGWHLNPHIDYKVHPKLGFERKVSLLFYLSENWKNDNDGNLVFFRDQDGRPDYDETYSIAPKFNSLVLFECTDTSWHGVTSINCAEDQSRKALGLFFLKDTGNQTGGKKRNMLPIESSLTIKTFTNL